MQGEFDFNKYPYKAGHRKVRTSVMAADDINKQLGRLQKFTYYKTKNYRVKITKSNNRYRKN